MYEADRLHKTLDWKMLFPKSALEKGEQIATKLQITKIQSWYGNYYRILYGRKSIDVRLYSVPTTLGDTWSDSSFECSECSSRRIYGNGKQNPYCEHAAAVLFHLEKENGPWTVWESDNDYRNRKKEQELKALRAQRDATRKKVGINLIPALQAFGNRTAGDAVYFDLEALLAPYITTPAAIALMPEAENVRVVSSYSDYSVCEIRTTREGEKSLVFSQRFSGPLEDVKVWGSIEDGKLEIQHNTVIKNATTSYISDSYRENERKSIDTPLDEYDLVTIRSVWDKADEESTKKITDDGAEKFFRSIRKMREESAIKETRTVEKVAKKAVVDLLPRIVLENGVPILSFKIGVGSSKKYILKDCYQLIRAVQKEGDYVLGKKETLHFAEQDFTPNGEVLFDFIRRNQADAYAGTYQVPLKGSRLDNFYDMYNGECELLDKTNNIRDEIVRVGHMDIRFKLTADRLADARDRFIGITVSGFVPVMISGNSHKYVINTTGLSRVSAQEISVLTPFISVSDSAGYFRFQVGKDRLQEFYYRVLPGLLENPFVEFVDNCVDEASGYLPPEPAFTFYLDLDDSNNLTIRGVVRYDELEYPLIPAGAATGGGYHDVEQEERALASVKRWASTFKPSTNSYVQKLTDDRLYDLLTVGISELEYYGQVKGTSGFLSKRIISGPAVQVGVSVDSGGLLNISVISKELSPKELLDVYNSYVQKKRYYRLKSGDFVDLTQDEQLGELSTFLEQMQLLPKDVINSKLKVPMYRALYLDRMLEDHEKLASTRDRTYRALIRNFKTVRDAEFEVPKSLEDIMRPYQVYGYKWLKTLEGSGFGGILADEMGLGKTLQMISIFKEYKDERSGKRGKKEESKPSLVVCPASLVYNWQEEIRKFAPDLTVSVLAGTQGVRKKALADMNNVDVFITSYDLLKRDIALYGDLAFSNCVLDEAQYIKNSKAAAAKTVKLINAEHRYALTGTPIENRLSELWSIFDFLMPGFLYDQGTFQRDYELPIAKYRDEAVTERLKTMTSPFILRRKKVDVLKDLPAKLEEVRYAHLEGEQQKIYDGQVVRMKEMLSGGELAGEEKIKIFAELT
ncbi:MAG: SNF2 helicase associated domain-containing protein, partial [Clostridia bacterium]|nr:SNF2 helicase associated domain-containing protein [Clostridia bacterium]